MEKDITNTHAFNSGYKIRDQSGIHYLTFQIVYWIDIFTRKIYKDIFIDSLKFCRTKKGLNIHAYVIMSNHVHLILSSKNAALSDTIRDLKTHTSKAFLKEMESVTESRREWMKRLFVKAAGEGGKDQEFKLWTHDNHPVQLETNSMIKQKLNYIHENPVRTGFVLKPEDYIYSSASAYCGLEKILDVDYLQ